MEGHFSHFTRNVLAFSREEAVRLGHEAIGPEHLLLGLLRLETGTANEILGDLGCDPQVVRDAIEASKEPGPPVLRDIPLTSSAEAVLQASALEAARYNSPFIGTEHLLLALLREDNPAARILHEQCEATYQSIRAAINQKLGVSNASDDGGLDAALDKLLQAFDSEIATHSQQRSTFRSSRAIQPPASRIRMNVAGIRSTGNGVYRLELSEQDGARRLSFVIGAYEAQAISIERDVEHPPRPMTHDLLRLLAEESGLVIHNVCIDAWKNETFFSYLHVANGPKEALVDARPSDAVALAVRVGCPIYAAYQVVSEAGRAASESA